MHAQKILLHTNKYGRWQDEQRPKEVRSIWSQSRIRWGKDMNWHCYFSTDFLKLGLTDCNAIMSLRIECPTFCLCTSKRAVGTNKFVVSKILIGNLIDDGFSVKEMSNILCVIKNSSKMYGRVWLKNQEFF